MVNKKKLLQLIKSYGGNYNKNLTIGQLSNEIYRLGIPYESLLDFKPNKTKIRLLGGSNDILEKKLVSSFTIPINKAIHLVSVNPDSIPVGSFSYKIHRYPGDIDMRELIIKCCDKLEASIKISYAIRKLASEILNQQGYFLADFKAGLDNRYNIYIGEYKKRILVGYNYHIIFKKINKLFTDDLLSQQEYNELIKFIKSDITEDEYNELKELLRQKYIIRWNMDELLQGYKFLIGGNLLYLYDAITQKTSVKLDIWAPIDGRYVEVSNYMVLFEIDKDGNEKVLNMEEPDYIESIRNDIKFFLSPTHQNVFKSIKRIWLIAASINDIDMLNKIDPLLSSGPAIMYQVYSDIKTLIDMLNKLKKNIPWNTIINEIDGFKSRLSYVYELQFDEKYIDEKIDSILLYSSDTKFIVLTLKDIENHIINSLNEFMIEYINLKKILPLPIYYLPNV